MRFAWRRFGTSGAPVPLTESELLLPDEELGWLLLELQLRDVAARLGFTLEAAPAGFVSQARRAMALKETELIESAGMEKAYRLAAQGEFARAGRTLRAWTLDMGQRLADTPRAAADRAREAKAKLAGAKGGSAPKPAQRKLPADIKEQFAALVAEGRSERDARSVLVQKYGVTTQGLGKALK